MVWAIAAAIAVAWIGWQYLTAPYGYEDSTGFHMGKPGDPS